MTDTNKELQFQAIEAILKEAETNELGEVDHDADAWALPDIAPDVFAYSPEQLISFERVRQDYKVGDSDVTSPDYFTNGLASFDSEATSRAPTSFSSQHVEVLLDESIDILREALEHREIANGLAAKAFQIKLELEEFEQLDRIHQEEIEAGGYRVAYQKAYHDMMAERHNSHKMSTALWYLERTKENQFSWDNINKVASARNCQAWAGVGPLFSHSQDYFKYRYNGHGFSTNHDKTDTVHIAQQVLSEFDILNQWASVNRQYKELEGRLKASKQREQGHRKTAEWLRKNINHRLKKLKTTRDLNSTKILAFITPGGALNYVEQLAPLKARIQMLMSYAYSRMLAAYQGLQTVYNLNMTLPESEDNYKFLDDCYNWNIEVINRITILQRKDTNFVWQLSLKQLLSAADFDLGKTQKQWRFTLVPSMLQGYEYLRMRGVSVHVMGQGIVGTYRFKLYPPESAVQIFDEQEVNVEQSLSIVTVGRARVWADNNPADVSGVSGLHNGSPLGEWTLTCETKSTGHISVDYLSDLLIDIHLATTVRN